MTPAMLATFFFALSSVTAARSVSHVGPAAANFLRILVATAVLGVYAHGFGGGLGGTSQWWFFTSGLIGYGLGDFGIFRALPLIGARLASLLTQCLAAPIAACVEWAWLGTRLGTHELLSGFTILAGVGLALSPGHDSRTAGSPAPPTSPHLAVPVRRGMFWVGVCFGVLGALGQAGGAVISRHGMLLASTRGGAVDAMTVAYQRILPGLLFAFVWLLVSRRTAVLRRGTPFVWRRAMPWFLLNGMVGPCLGVSCYQQALREQPTGIVMSIVALTPLAVIPLAIGLGGEKPTVRSILGGCIAVAGTIALVGFRHR